MHDNLWERVNDSSCVSAAPGLDVDRYRYLDGGNEGGRGGGKHMESVLPLCSQTRAATFSGHFNDTARAPREPCVSFLPFMCETLERLLELKKLKVEQLLQRLLVTNLKMRSLKKL